MGSKLMGSKDDAATVQYMKDYYNNNIQLSPEGQVNSGGYILRREASRYICITLH